MNSGERMNKKRKKFQSKNVKEIYNTLEKTKKKNRNKNERKKKKEYSAENRNFVKILKKGEKKKYILKRKLRLKKKSGQKIGKDKEKVNSGETKANNNNRK